MTKLIRHPFGYFTLSDKPSAEDLSDYYAKKYYQQAIGSYELQYSDEEKKYIKAKLEQRYAFLQQISPSLAPPPHTPPTHHPHSRKHKMLDVGCGEGFALAYFRELGWSVKGLDFSAAGVESQNPSCRDALYVGDIFSLLDIEITECRKYDVVWLQNVLEHVLDPVALLRSLRSLMAQDGIAVVTVPNDFSKIQMKALSYGHIDQEFWVTIPDHITYFDSDSLLATVKETGWKCTKLIGDFPIDWFLYHEGSNYIKNIRQGKAAHQARIQLENIMHQKSIADACYFWEAAGRLGVGRNITVFLKK
ncbi:class I SAM-dependent methyltransferase [Zobellella sp. An-6]|uniref:class I SAM-dependent methyltransferase n=1 Tax=Zobellella sp. An-6 TaxID=3400218 RepID=UPI0040418AE1